MTTTDDERGRVERVARAIKAARYVCGSDGVYRCNTEMELARVAIAAMREGEQKQEGEARAAGETYCDANAEAIMDMADALDLPTGKDDRDQVLDAVRLCVRDRDEAIAYGVAMKERAEAAESLAKAEREGRESEGVAYREEIEHLRARIAVVETAHAENLRRLTALARQALVTEVGEQRMRDADDATKRIQDEMACQTCDGSGMIEVEGETGRGGAEFTNCPECRGQKTP